MKSQGKIESDKMEQESGLFYELDKGIDAMKRGRTMQHDEAMQMIREKLKEYAE